ncbi:MAG: response regulator [Anaerolineae bacterium]|nr:response regulator [Anaerolineae bacterium]
MATCDPSTWRVLVVEDEYDSIQMVSKILRHHGAEVHVARTGLECLHVLQTLEPDLVIMDLALPEMDGWETLAKIRANPHTQKLPVVAITAYHSVSVAEDAKEAGFNAYYPKPLNTNRIIDQLGEIVEVG